MLNRGGTAQCKEWVAKLSSVVLTQPWTVTINWGVYVYARPDSIEEYFCNVTVARKYPYKMVSSCVSFDSEMHELGAKLMIARCTIQEVTTCATSTWFLST